ncbi:hypothetical protein Tco_0172659 [Tanacetum coccineum]
MVPTTISHPSTRSKTAYRPGDSHNTNPNSSTCVLVLFPATFLLHTSHILKSGSVKSTWDSLNIFLVIFAILCGVLACKNEGVNESTNFVGDSSSGNSTSVDSSGQVFGYSDTKVVSGGLRRSSSCYPDLRNGSVWENNRENRHRFYDNFDVYNSSPMTRYYGRSRSRRDELDPVEFSDVKEIVVDTVAPVTVTAAAPPPPPPPPPQRESSKKHSFRSVGRNEFEKVRTEPPSQPPPPPPAVAETTVNVRRTRHKHKKLERKVSDATKEIATAISNISSMYTNYLFFSS